MWSGWALGTRGSNTPLRSTGISQHDLCWAVSRILSSMVSSKISHSKSTDIYFRSLAGIVLDRGQCAMCVVGHATHYPRGSSWEIDISPSKGRYGRQKSKTVFHRVGFSGLITLNLYSGSLPESSSAHLGQAFTLRGKL